MKENISIKRENEKKVVNLMIKIYCKGHNHGREIPCSECKKLIEYAELRTNLCPFMENKTFCSNCKVHCYKPDMREKIKEVMKYSGRRMLLYHPILAIKHVKESMKEKRGKKNDDK
ncbi:MAG: nitrous oxide-stimulated promoter family protein [Clostridium sp.]|nr:nitrous oxide-stimulated promoter family protein [Clostridium sp.]